jgi:exonuclease SbcC
LINHQKTLHEQLINLPQVNKDQDALINQLHNIVKSKEIFLQQQGRLEKETEQLAELEKEYNICKKNIIELKESIDDYLAIACATGKDGLQALLIEDIIPEVEQEANNILTKMTDNQAQIIIESLRDLKNGNAKETLDIKISDNMGIRPYEMFSGGEAFRIDFALRVAISKLLARRAGTSLQTLIIDEGFGSQDEEGLSHIMDAIYKIQDDFCKIIIVSHLTVIKDQFPIHFFIHKNTNGSVVTIIEQA